MAGALAPHDEGGVDEEDDPKHQEVGEPVKARSHSISHGQSIDGSRMLPALPVEEWKGS